MSDDGLYQGSYGTTWKGQQRLPAPAPNRCGLLFITDYARQWF